MLFTNLVVCDALLPLVCVSVLSNYTRQLYFSFFSDFESTFNLAQVLIFRPKAIFMLKSRDQI